MADRRYTARQAIRKALQNSLRYERLGYCRKCEEVHTEPKHLMSLNLIAEEVYLWLGFGREQHDLRLFTRLIKTLEDAPVTGKKDQDIALLTDRLSDSFGGRAP